MLFAIGLIILFVVFASKLAPRERAEDAHVHGAGQVGLLAAVALFGVDYFTSYFYATGELMNSLHPYGLQKWGYIAAGVIALANLTFGLLYMYSLGIFTEGGGSYTASMRYLFPTLSLIVAVVLIQDYILTIVVSALSGGEQLLSILNLYGKYWWLHFLIGAVLASVTYFLTIRGRGESANVVFTLLGIFVFLTITMAIGLIIAHVRGIPAAPVEVTHTATLRQALYHLLTASMKGMVALSGLEAMSDGIQFVRNEDAGIVKWGKKFAPRLNSLWNFYSGKSGIGRLVQTAFLFYGGLTTYFLTTFAIRFNVYDGTFGRTLVGNLAYIGFGVMPGGEILYWAYQILAVLLLAAASMTAFQDLQATAWRDVAIGEIPEVVVYRNPQGTFTRSVTAGFIIAVILMLIVRGRSTAAMPYYGVGVFMPIAVMGFAIRKHIQKTATGRKRTLGMVGATSAGVLSILIFIMQIIGKWEEGGWAVLISFSVLILLAHTILVSRAGFRDPQQIHRIVREKARVQGAMASIVEWQSLKMQEYRYSILRVLMNVMGTFGVRFSANLGTAPVPAGDYDHAVHLDHPEAPSLLAQYLEPVREPMLGGKPKETAASGSYPGD